MNTVTVSLAERSYDILIGESLLADAGAHLAPVLPQKRAIVVTDETVAAHWLALLEGALAAEGIRTEAITVAPGEQSKSFPVLATLMSELLQLRPERKTALIALGGGVIGDLTGFAASICLRGVPFVQVPTTLLAQVDSSVGGKTGINTPEGKNLVGSFYQPKRVLIDTATLSSLPLRERRAGYAEIVKYGLINDAAFFGWLEANGARVAAGEADALAYAIEKSCRAKAAIVAQDEKESGVRALLNLGHTFGHALEAECGFSSELLHGEAVAVGMQMAFDFSVRLNLCPAQDAERLRAHLKHVGLPASPRAIRPAWDANRLIAHFHQDKKVQDGALTFILARAIGEAFVARDVYEGDLRGWLEGML
jgi:3-dehydroquinate synthase